jgi:hypothetical protein
VTNPKSGWPAAAAAALLAATAVALIPLHAYPAGLTLLALTAVATAALEPRARRDFVLATGAVALLALTPINTHIDLPHMFVMGSILSAAVAVPYVMSRYAFGDHTITFPLHHGRRWYKTEIAYILVTAAIAYFVLPWYLRVTGSYLNWQVLPGAAFLTRLFIGTNALGLWDELFFVCTILGLLRRHLPFWQANIAQSVMWTAFLYELGFRGFGPLILFIFALSQGYIFKRTASVIYIVTIHLTLDLVLYLALVHAYYPQWLPIFVIK